MLSLRVSIQSGFIHIQRHLYKQKFPDITLSFINFAGCFSMYTDL